jgi:hypothetical protein
MATTAKQQTRKTEDFKNLGTVHNRAKADITLIDEDKRMIPFIIVSDDNAGLRYDWWSDEIFEERLEPSGATFGELNTFFKDHRMSVDNAIGRIENTRLDGGQIKTDVVFGTDAESEVIYNKFREGILTDVSIGYSIQEVITTERENEPTEVLVTKFDIHELSAVWKGFDSKATVGREAEENLEEEDNLDEETNEGVKNKRSRNLDLLEMA